MNKTFLSITIMSLLILSMAQATEWKRINDRTQPFVTNQLLMTQKNPDITKFYSSKTYYSNACGRKTLNNIVSPQDCMDKGMKYCETTQKNVMDYKNCTNQFLTRCTAFKADLTQALYGIPLLARTITIDLPCTTKSKFQPRQILPYSFTKNERIKYGITNNDVINTKNN